MSNRRKPRPAGVPPIKAPPRGFFHDTSVDYALNDGPFGIALAAVRGLHWIDLDFQCTADGHIVCLHWDDPMAHGWEDPAHEYHAGDKVYRMPLAAVLRLRNKHDHRLRIITATQALTMAARKGLNVEFEVKNSPQFATARVWARLSLAVKRIRKTNPGWRIEVKMLSQFRTWPEALRLAYSYGFTTILLPRGSRVVGRSCWPYVCQVRGFVIWRPVLRR